MDAATDEVISKAQGRKDAAGQPAAIRTKFLKDAIDDGVALKVKADEAADTYADWVTSMAEKTGLNAPVVRKVVNAKANDKWEDEARKAEQLNLAFDEIGE